MNRKLVFYSNKHERKNVAQLSPRLAAKRPQPILQASFIGQSSAQMKRRKPDAKIVRLESPVYSRPKAELKKINEQKQLLSEQQIRGSALYKMLEQEIKELARRQEQEIQKLKKIRQDRKKQSEALKKEQFATKLQLWELKNQVCEIRQLIQDQKLESDRLAEEIRPVGERNNAAETEEQEQAEQEVELTENQEQSYETQEQGDFIREDAVMSQYLIS